MNIGRRNHWNGIKIPPFATTSFQRPKLLPGETESLAKNLLLTVRDNPRALLNKNVTDNPLSISDQLALLYIEYVENEKIKDDNFMKCNFLEDLVIRKNMSYFILSLYPEYYILSIKIPGEVLPIHRAEYAELELLDHIDDEHIPRMIFDLLLNLAEELESNWNLFYDNHMIVKIEKFLSKDKGPVCSFFILLRPTDLTNNYIVGKCTEDESSTLCDLSGPLCLNPADTLAELHDYILSYNGCFGSDDIKSVIVKKREIFLLSCQKSNNYEKDIWSCLEKADFTQLMKSVESEEESLKVPSWNFIEVAHYVTSVLRERPVNIGHTDSCCSSITMLTDVFHFIVKINGEKHLVYKMLVYVYDGTYYFYLKNDKIKFSLPQKEGNKSWIGSRENVTMIISCFSELISSVYGDFEIYHERTFENDKSLILCASDYFDNTEKTENKDADASCEDVSTSYENVSASCEDASASYEDASTSYGNASTSYGNASTSYEDASSSYENASASCEDANCSLLDDTIKRTFYTYRSQTSNEEDEEDDFEEREDTDMEDQDDDFDLDNKKVTDMEEEDEDLNEITMEGGSLDPDIRHEKNIVNESQCIESDSATIDTADESLFAPYQKEIANIMQSSTASKSSSDTEITIKDFSEGIIFESESVKAILEAHLFDEEESSALVIKSDNLSEEDSSKKLEIYPSLRTQVELTSSDYVSYFAPFLEMSSEDLDRLS